jgi:hypothetical protein
MPLARVFAGRDAMIRKLKSGEYRLYSQKKNRKTGKRKNLGTFATRHDIYNKRHNKKRAY